MIELWDGVTVEVVMPTETQWGSVSPILIEDTTPAAAHPEVGVEIPVPAASASWVLPVPSNFGRRPNVAVYLPSGEQVIADVVATLTQVSVVFANPTAGSAVLT